MEASSLSRLLLQLGLMVQRLFPEILLLGKHTIFGRISAGMGVIRRMGMVETNKEDR
jgi:hypothetical protein